MDCIMISWIPEATEIGEDWLWLFCMDVPQLPGGNNAGGGCWRSDDKAEGGGGGGGGGDRRGVLLLLVVYCWGTLSLGLVFDEWLVDSPRERPWCWCDVSEGEGIWL